MKIYELRFKNLNSLYGEWYLDFSDPEYAANGIFALTGPTGAGKSTILDALCLALYGATPRLGRITKSANEIMSRQTGECFAEAVFGSRGGKYRCYWEQHRARKKADGKLTDAVHEISDAETGQIIENKKSLVSAVIEEKTGMDFDRFTRSILLAQGSFDTFLKADNEQKSKILEQITGTEIYSDISKCVHEKRREEKDKLSMLQKETSWINVLNEEEELKIKKDIEEKTEEEKRLTFKSDETEKSLSWLTGIERLKNEIESLSSDTVTLENEMESFKPERELLEKALRSAVYDGDYAELNGMRKQQGEDEKSLLEEHEKLSLAESLYKEKLQSLENAEKNTLTAKADIKDISPVIQKVRSLDQKIIDKNQTLNKEQEIIRKIKTGIENNNIKKTIVEKKIEQNYSDLKSAEEYIKNHSSDEELVGSLTGIEENLSSLLLKQKENDKKKIEEKTVSDETKNLTEKIDKIIIQKNEKKLILDEAVKLHTKVRDDLKRLLNGKLLREYRSDMNACLREMKLLERIANLEDYRLNLEDGKPCPLCGSEVHPYAEGNIPEKDEIDKKIDILNSIINKAEDQEELIKQLEKNENDERVKLNQIEKLESDALNEKKLSEKILFKLSENIKEGESEFQNQLKGISQKLKDFGIGNFTGDNISTVIGSLKERLESWKKYTDAKSISDMKISDLRGELKSLESVIETQLNSLSENENELKSVKTEYDELLSKRRRIFGDKNPDIVEHEINNALEDAENGEKLSRRNHDEALQSLTAVKNNIKSLKERINERIPELKKLEREFEKLIYEAGFTDEKHFLDSRLPIEKRERLSRKAKELDERDTELRARKKDRKDRLSLESAKNITEKTLKEIQTLFNKIRGELIKNRDYTAGQKHKIADNENAKEKIKGKKDEIDVQKNECIRWDNLHTLIGSADGSKFRKYAQGITFEMMVSHANRQLEKMTDRYLLVRDNDEPLDLNVADNYQAGEIRSTKNLSGGESFIVSLSLALGLSKMASRKVRVDSLFLDEGFGTLDEDALETALETLSSLQQDGKLIGVISHVSALKERITTQIAVNPVSGGKSSITGPGCRKIV